MSTNFPGSLDDAVSLPNPTAVSKTNNPSHASQHANENDAIKAIEAKVGTGATTPSANTLLRGTGSGTSEWSAITSAQLAATISDETGTGSAVFANTPTLSTPKMDVINEATAAAGVTIDGVLLKDNKMNGSYITDSTVGNSQLALGVPVQVVSTSYSAVATGTTTIPVDDTIPQNTEGTEFMTCSITPKSAANKLYIHVNIHGSLSVGSANTVAALFRDTTANAIAATQIFQSTATAPSIIIIDCPDISASSTSATTFKVRVGPGAAATYTLNGQSGGRLFGAVTKSLITITEYKA